jgi:DNA mismatch repair protein MSH4
VAIAQKRKLLLSLREQLVLARDGTMDDGTLRCVLIKLQNDFVMHMAAINQEMGMHPDSESVADADARAGHDSDVSAHTSEAQVSGFSENCDEMEDTHATEPIVIDSGSEICSESDPVTRQ